MTTSTINIVGIMDWDNDVQDFAERSIVIDIQSMDSLEKFMKKTCSRSHAKQYSDFDISYYVEVDDSVTVEITTTNEVYFANHNGMTSGNYLREIVRRFADYLIRES